MKTKEAMEESPLAVGQRVHWTEMAARKGNSICFKTRFGKVAGCPTGPMVVVRYRGREITKLRTQLRTEGQHTELTEWSEPESPEHG